jgi:hypothetical protein
LDVSQRRQPDVGLDARHVEAAAAIDDNGHLWTEPPRQIGRRDHLADGVHERARIGDLVRVEPGKRSRLHWNALAHGDAESVDVGSERRHRTGFEASDLQAAPPGDFKNAVAMPESGFRQSRERCRREITICRAEAHQQAIARLHGRRKRGTRATG